MHQLPRLAWLTWLFRCCSQNTFKVLKAVLHILGKKPDTFKNWKRVYE